MKIFVAVIVAFVVLLSLQSPIMAAPLLGLGLNQLGLALNPLGLAPIGLGLNGLGLALGGYNGLALNNFFNALGFGQRSDIGVGYPYIQGQSLSEGPTFLNTQSANGQGSFYVARTPGSIHTAGTL